MLDKTSLAQLIAKQGPNYLIIARHGETSWNAEGRSTRHNAQPTRAQSGHSNGLVSQEYSIRTCLLQ
jgi:hypothetical protein